MPPIRISINADSTANINATHKTVSFLISIFNNFITDSILPPDSGLPDRIDQPAEQTFLLYIALLIKATKKQPGNLLKQLENISVLYKNPDTS